MKTAIIAGATGLIGAHLLEALLKNEKFEKVKILVRKPLKKKHPKLEEYIIDFDRIGNYTDIMAADYAFCCLGTTIKNAGSQDAFYKVDFTYVTEFAKFAQAQGSQEFCLVSAMGADAKSFIFYNRVKGEVEHTVKAVPFRAVHILRPSLLLGDRTENRLGEAFGKKLNKWLNPIIPPKYKGIEAKTVAKAMEHLSSRTNEGVYVYFSDVIQKMGEVT